MAKDKNNLNRRLAALSSAQVSAPPPSATSSKRKQRSAERVSAYRFARLLLPSGQQVNCIIRDISANGARIMIEGNFEIPRRVVLKIDQTGQTNQAGVVWQKENELGLAFVH